MKTKTIGVKCFIVFLCMVFTWPARAQEFVKVTAPDNPVVQEPGPSNYSGASWVDYNDDGLLDLFINNNGLYKNTGDGNFTKVLTSVGTGLPQSAANGNSWADYDNDGDMDVFITGVASYLYRNDGNDQFTRISSGDIGNGAQNPGWSCAWADLNNDGFIDLAVTHAAGFLTQTPTTNHLFINTGPPEYSFQKITGTPITEEIKSHTVGTWSDYDLDGDVDYFIGSGPADMSKEPDNLFENLYSQTGVVQFARITQSPIATDLQDGQVWNWIDYDNDGDLDACLTNFWGGESGGMRNRLYRNDNGTYTALTNDPIVTDRNFSLANVWGDFDNDGDLDCFVTSDGANPPTGPADRYYRNNGDGTFSRISAGISENLVRRGAAAGDYDNDGDLDLIAVGPSTAKSLYRNDTDNGNNWVKVRCIGSAENLEQTYTNRAGIGAKVKIKATIFGNTYWQIREISAQNSFNGHNQQIAHFGLGDAETIDSLVVEFTSGIKLEIAGAEVNQFKIITEASVINDLEDDIPQTAGFFLHQNFPNPFNQNTNISFTLNDKTEVNLSVYNLWGQEIIKLYESVQPQGFYSLTWDGTDQLGNRVAPGIYLLRLSSGGNNQWLKMTLVR